MNILSQEMPKEAMDSIAESLWKEIGMDDWFQQNWKKVFVRASECYAEEGTNLTGKSNMQNFKFKISFLKEDVHVI